MNAARIKYRLYPLEEEEEEEEEEEDSGSRFVGRAVLYVPASRRQSGSQRARAFIGEFKATRAYQFLFSPLSRRAYQARLAASSSFV
jgi:hypothetical protein